MTVSCFTTLIIYTVSRKKRNGNMLEMTMIYTQLQNHSKTFVINKQLFAVNHDYM